MQTVHYPYTKLKTDLYTIASKHLDLSKYKLFIFGSRATDTGDDHSDIDIGIEGTQSVPLATLSSFHEDLENLPTLYTFDLVDFSTVTDSFKKTAKLKIISMTESN